VLDNYQVAGTFDRLLNVPGFDLPLIGDLKTGRDLSYSWQSIAVQLAIYCRADFVYKQGAKADGSDDERLMMPAVDQNYGLILWLNAGTGQLELFLVDLTLGWEAFEHSMWTRGWRQIDPVERYDTRAAPVLDTQLEASLEARGIDPDEAERRLRIRGTRGWLQQRIDNIGAFSSAARSQLARAWPSDLPTLRSSDEHTRQQLAEIEKILDLVEAANQMPFPGPQQATTEDEAVAAVVDLFPGSTIQ
jgi:hypothetical protein